MKFICFHGAIGNSDNFSIQLHPLEKELTENKVASFHYVNGICEVDPPEGFEEYFGAGPHYRWVDDGGLAADSMMLRVRALPEGETPEDVIRALVKGKEDDGSRKWDNRQELLGYLYKTMEADPEIEGVIGYSEGASLAGSLVLDEMHKFQTQGRPRQLKCAVFFTGWPPLGPDDRPVLADQSELAIDVHTLHIVGANDPYRDGALALYNVCDPDKAVLFDTGKGHTLPRGGPVLRELGEAVRDMILDASIDIE